MIQRFTHSVSFVRAICLTYLQLKECIHGRPCARKSIGEGICSMEEGGGVGLDVKSSKVEVKENRVPKKSGFISTRASPLSSICGETRRFTYSVSLVHFIVSELRH